MTPDFQYTVALTSCNRHDMLKRTLDSFVACADIFPVHTVIVEDSDAPRPDWLVYPQLGEITWVQNGERRGQGYTIDRAYAEVKTEYLFHMEDDRVFLKRGPFIADSHAILSQFPEVICVMLTNHPPWSVKDARYPFPLYKPSAGGLNPVYDGIAFANGLRRLSDYTKLGIAFAEFERGLDITKMTSAVVELYVGDIYRKMEHIIAHLGVGYTGHIGDKSPYLHEGDTDKNAPPLLG
jgi:hypothetical protein